MLAADTGSDAASYRHTGLTPNSARRYRVSAINALGVSRPSAAASATSGRFGDPDATAPTAETTLVSNFALEPDINLKLYVAPPEFGAGPDQWSELSQSFRTGPELTGLNSVRIDQVAIGAGEALALAVYGDFFGQPGVRVHELEGPDPESGTTKLFLARPGAVLDGKTTYHLVLSHQGGLMGIGSTRDLGQVGQDRWQIADHSRRRNVTRTEQAAQVLRFTLSGYLLPTMPRLTEFSALTDSSSAIELNWKVEQQRALLPVTGYLLQASGDGRDWEIFVPADELQYREEDIGPYRTRHYRVTPQTALGPAEPRTATATTLGDTLISNRGRPPGTSLAPNQTYQLYAQAFTTGSAKGVRLRSAELEFGSLCAAGQLVVALYDNDRKDRPDSELRRFAAVGPLQPGRNAFVLEPLAALEADTTYHLVVYCRDDGRFGGRFELATAGDGDEDSGGAPGWKLADHIHGFVTRNARWRLLDQDAAQARAINLRLTGLHPPQEPRDLEVDPSFPQELGLSWSQRGLLAGLSGYQVEVCTALDCGDRAAWSVVDTIGPDEREYFHTELLGDTEYTYRVGALSRFAGADDDPAYSDPTSGTTKGSPDVLAPGEGVEVLLSNAHRYTNSYGEGSIDFTDLPEYIDFGPVRVGESELPETTRVAQAFTTGPNPEGYLLTEIVIPAAVHDLSNGNHHFEIYLLKVDQIVDPMAFSSKAAEVLGRPNLVSIPHGVKVAEDELPALTAGELRLPFNLQTAKLQPDATYYIIIRLASFGGEYEGLWPLVRTPEGVLGEDHHLNDVSEYGAPGWSLVPGGLWRTRITDDDEQGGHGWYWSSVTDFHRWVGLKFRMVGSTVPVEVDPPTGQPSMKPSQPSGFSAYPVSPSSIMLRWSAPADDSGGPILSYKIERSTDRRTWISLATVRGQTQFVDEVAERGRRLHYRVSATNLGGRSEWSSASVFLLPVRFGSEELVNNLAAATDDVIDIKPEDDFPLRFVQRFTTGTNRGGYSLERVTLDVDSMPFGSLRLIQLRQPLRNPLFRELDPFFDRELIAEFHGKPDPAGDSGQLSFRVGGAPVLLKPQTEYTLYLYAKHSVNGVTRSTTLHLSANSPAASAIDSGWDIESTYRYGSVQAANVISADGQLALRLDGARLSAPDMPRLVVQSATDGIALSWETPREGSIPVTGYQIQRSQTPGIEASWRDRAELEGHDRTAYLDRTIGDGTIYYRVRALTRVGWSQWSAVASAARLGDTPARPRSPAAEADGHNAITVSWTPGLEGKAGPTTHYVVQWSADRLAWLDPVAQAPEEFDQLADGRLAYRDSGLNEKETRYYRVFAENEEGRSPASAVVSATTHASVAPAPPSGLTVSPSDSPGRLDLSWTAPEQTGGSCLIEYRIERSDDLGVTWQFLQAVRSPATTEQGRQVEDQEPSQQQAGCDRLPTTTGDKAVTAAVGTTPYSYRVRAVTASAVSEPSYPRSLDELPAQPLQVLLVAQAQVGSVRATDADGVRTTRGYRAAGQGPALGSLDERGFAYARQRYSVAALIQTELRSHDGGDPAYTLVLRLELLEPSADPPRLGRLRLALTAEGAAEPNVFELHEDEARRVDERDADGLVRASSYSWPLAEGELGFGAGVDTLELRIEAPYLSGGRDDRPVQAVIPADGRWYPFQHYGRSTEGARWIHLRAMLDVDQRYRIDFHPDPTGLSESAIELKQHRTLTRVYKPNGTIQTAHDQAVVNPINPDFYTPGGRRIEFVTSDQRTPADRMAGNFDIQVGHPRGIHSSALRARFWIRVTGSTEGIEQRSYSESWPDFPAGQPSPGTDRDWRSGLR